MAIYGRMGDEIELVREATVPEVLKEWGSTAKKRQHGERRTDGEIATERCGYGMMWWAKSKEDGQDRLYELAFCKADEGWKEITDTRRKLMGEERYAEASGMPVPA